MTQELTAKIVPTDTLCEGDKRQHVPFRVEMDCPSCGLRWNSDLSDDHHLCTPTWNEECDVYGYCEHCDAEWLVVVVPTITLTFVRVTESG